MEFHFLHLRGATNNWLALGRDLREATLPAWHAAGIAPWGCWQGLFGVASNELIVITVADAPVDPIAALPEAADLLEHRHLQATARPTTAAPCTREGLYVFRRFAVDTANIDTVARLSAQAWQTFEGADTYATEPFGLFAPADRNSQRCEMLLVTWYDGFDSWSTSRAPAAEARDNFQRRRELTYSTTAVATRLADLESA